ncbi:MAG: tetratricopeptide repeat protein [Candidatus Tectomicrobia bacterium]|nr:tetratricopeptide repeat protein [Candidatus Tectomicrobia bacterium]
MMSGTQLCMVYHPGKPKKSQRYKSIKKRFLLCVTVIFLLSNIITIVYWPLLNRIIEQWTKESQTEPFDVSRHIVRAENQEGQGRLAEAVKSYETALSLLNNRGNQRKLEAELRGRIGTLYWRMGDLGKAELSFSIVRAMYTQMDGMLQKQAVATHTIGRLLVSMGKTDKALELLVQAIDLYAKAKDFRGQIRARLDYDAVIMNAALSPFPVWGFPGV